jgi:hypothetical protein
VDIEHGDIFIAYVIPLAVLAAGARWGDTYSLDAALRQRRGLPPVDPQCGDGIYALPARAVLVIMALQFVSGALTKTLDDGTWLRYPGIMGYLAAKKNVECAMLGLPLNPLGPFMARTPWFYHPLQYIVLLFEATFFLALFNIRLRVFYLSLALFFHAVNALWFIVTFTSILIAYAMFVDWEKLCGTTLRRRVRVPTLSRTAPAVLIIGSLVIAIGFGLAWNFGGLTLRRAISLNGLIDWRTTWWPILPLAVISIFWSVAGIFIELAPQPHTMAAKVAVGSVEDNR